MLQYDGFVSSNTCRCICFLSSTSEGIAFHYTQWFRPSHTSVGPTWIPTLIRSINHRLSILIQRYLFRTNGEPTG